MESPSLQSEILRTSPHEWHVLSGGAGETILFLHGAGASAGSFSGVMKLLAKQFSIVAPDLPGHATTRLGTRGRSGLNAMAEDIASLVAQRFKSPLLIVGHSAGSAIALRLSKLLSPRGLFLINPALDPFDGVAGWAFPALARGLSVAPFSGDLLASLFGRERRILELLEATGSVVDHAMKERYLSLARNPQHIRGTLAMMAAWDVGGLRANLAEYECDTTVLIGTRDTTVLPAAVRAAVSDLPSVHIIERDAGHLIHEEAPDIVADLITEKTSSLEANPD